MDISSFYPGMFSTTILLPCPYIKGRLERKLFTKLPEKETVLWASVLSRAGFRRSQNICYLPVCPDCADCVSVRVDALHFNPDKKQKKIMRLNDDLRILFIPNIATKEQYDLFCRYLKSRHKDSEMNEMKQEAYRSMIEDTPINSVLMEVRTKQENELKGVMLLDETDDGFSAVYSFFDPLVEKRSLGTFMIISLIERLKRLNRPYAYLGYQIKACSNMDYKKRFRPLERFEKGRWVSVTD